MIGVGKKIFKQVIRRVMIAANLEFYIAFTVFLTRLILYHEVEVIHHLVPEKV